MRNTRSPSSRMANQARSRGYRLLYSLFRGDVRRRAVPGDEDLWGGVHV